LGVNDNNGDDVMFGSSLDDSLLRKKVVKLVVVKKEKEIAKRFGEETIPQIYRTAKKRKNYASRSCVLPENEQQTL